MAVLLNPQDSRPELPKVNNDWIGGGAILRDTLYSKPSIAMSLRTESGASEKSIKDSLCDMPISAKKESCMS